MLKCARNASHDHEVVIDLMQALCQLKQWDGTPTPLPMYEWRDAGHNTRQLHLGGCCKQYLHRTNFALCFYISLIRGYLCENSKPAMVYITRIEHFNAAHKLYNPAWSREQNEAVFWQMCQ